MAQWQSARCPLSCNLRQLSASSGLELFRLTPINVSRNEERAGLLPSLRDRGLGAPVLAVGDGNLGFWAAIREVFPSIAEEQRYWATRLGTVSTHSQNAFTPQAESAIQAIYNASTPHRAGRRLRPSPEPSRASRRPRPRSWTSSTPCSPSTTSRPSTPSTSGLPTRSSPAFSSVRLRTRVTRWCWLPQSRLGDGQQTPRRRPRTLAQNSRPGARPPRTSSRPRARVLSHVDLDDVTEHAEDIRKAMGSLRTRRLRTRAWRRLAAIPCLITG